MGPKKNSKQNVKLIVMGVIGIVLTAAYFSLITASPLVDFLQPHESGEKILSMAESFFWKLPVNHSRFDRRISIGIDEDLLAYVQYYEKKNHQYANLTPGFWIIDWHLTPGSDKPNRSKRSFQIRYDFKGNLVGFRDNASEPAVVDSIKIILT